MREINLLLAETSSAALSVDDHIGVLVEISVGTLILSGVRIESSRW